MSRFDRRIDRALDRIRGRAWADRVFYTASAVGDHGLLWFALAGLRAARGPQERQAARRAVVGVAVDSAVVNLGVKSLFRRVRPASDGDHPLPLRRPRTSSFPSGHASSAFTAAALLGEGDPWRPVYYGLAVVVATSRVYVRIHHASDVVGGAAVGALIGRLGRRLAPLRGVSPTGESAPIGRCWNRPW